MVELDRREMGVGRAIPTSVPDLPKVYNSTKLVVHDAASHTREWGSLNSRVFEALAAGSLVLTSNAIGSAELFNSRLPVWNDANELGRIVQHYMENPKERRDLAASLTREVVERHSYKTRARTLRGILDETMKQLRIAIKCPVPRETEAEAWGDYHFATSLRQALIALGYRVRIDLLPAWYCERGLADDVVIVLRGLSTYQTSSDQINICWMISHPAEVPDAELQTYDHVFVASTMYAAELRGRLTVPVTPLLQCSDPYHFHPPATSERAVGEDLLFVGNSRKRMRPVIAASAEAGLPLAIHGRDWDGLAPASAIKGTHIANGELYRHYGNARIVLNDHWPDMAANGFISNRIFDVALSGGFVISDEFVGSDLFGGDVPTFDGPAGLREIVEKWLPDDAGRRAIGARLRKFVLAGHTFDHRAKVLHETIARLAELRAAYPADAPLGDVRIPESAINLRAFEPA